MTISSVAYARNGAAARARESTGESKEPAIHAPSASPPMNAASTVLAAATV